MDINVCSYLICGVGPFGYVKIWGLIGQRNAAAKHGELAFYSRHDVDTGVLFVDRRAI